MMIVIVTLTLRWWIDMAIVNKVIIVEGKSDKKRVQQVIAEPANIICTHGTMSIDKIDNMIETLYDKQVYVLADSDDEGEKIRKWFKRYLSESEHIYVDKTFCEVAKCPKNYLAHVLSRYGFNVKKENLFFNLLLNNLLFDLFKIQKSPLKFLLSYIKYIIDAPTQN